MKGIILIIPLILTLLGIGNSSKKTFFTQLVQLKELHDCTLLFSDYLSINSTTPSTLNNFSVDLEYQKIILRDISDETLIDIWIFSTELSSNDKILQLESPFNRVKKHGENCILFFALLEDELDESTSQSMYNFIQYLTPGLYPIVQRNEDYFAFITRNNSLLSSILQNEKIAYKLKYKIGIVYDQKGNLEMSLRVKTLFLYGGPNGQGRITENFYQLNSVNSQNSSLFHKIFPDFTKNLNGQRIILATIKVSPMVRLLRIIGQDGDEEYIADGKGGMQYQNFYRVAQVMNFTFKIIMASGGGGSGMKFPNGSWNGEIGDVLNGIANVGILAGINSGRYAAVDFTAFHQYMSLLLLHGPTPPVFSWRALFWSFRRDLWIGIMMSIVFVVSFLNLIRPLHVSWPTSNWRSEPHELSIDLNKLMEKKIKYKTRMRIMSQKELTERKRYTWSFSETIAFIIPSFLLQSYMIPRSDATKTFSIFWFLFVIVITTVYSSKLFGLFVSPPMERSPTTMEELAVSDYKIHMTFYGGFLHHWFKTSKNNTAPREIFKIWHLEHPTVCMKRAFIPKFACIAYYTDFEIMRAGLKVVSGKNKQIIHHPLDAFQITLGMVIEKNWILSQSFNRVTRSSFDIGLTNFWAKESGSDDRQAQSMLKITNANHKYNETDTVWPEPTVSQGTVNLTLLHLRGAFTVFSVGTGVALISFLTEKFLKYIQIIPMSLAQTFEMFTRHSTLIKV